MIDIQLKPDEVQIWHADLNITEAEESIQASYLSQDEVERALRFHFSIHRKRFIAARYQLRQLLGLYINLPPEKISLKYTKHDKPYLSYPDFSPLQFNLAHSENTALYAFRWHYPLGIDLEKIESTYPQGIAERFFSPAENKALLELLADEKIEAFYQMWARKEALIKAIGKGLSIPLASFSVSIDKMDEEIEYENKIWYITSLPCFDNFKAALASSHTFFITFKNFPSVKKI